MIDLTPFFRSPFAGRNVSFANLHKFTTDHLGLLKSNADAGNFTARQAATVSALAAFDAAIMDNEGQLGQRKMAKQNKKAFRKALPAEISKISIAIQAEFGVDALELTKCFPEGLIIFARCRDAMLENHLDVLIAGLTTLEPALEPGVRAQAEALRDQWLPLHAASGLAGADKKVTEQARRDARRNLERELYLNLLALAQAYPLQPEKLAEFMQVSLLLPHRHHPAAPSTPPG